MKVLVIFFLALFFSCSPYKFSKQQFSYTENNQAQTVQLLVPKGFKKQEVSYDSAGNKQQFYFYDNGAFFYVTNTGNSINPNERIDTSMHEPKEHPKKGLIYKGVMPNFLFWREIRLDNFRIGYRNVPGEWEVLFDSATNYASMQPLQRRSR